jgi:hypothetical protein
MEMLDKAQCPLVAESLRTAAACRKWFNRENLILGRTATPSRSSQ